MMKDKNKTRQQLIEELEVLQRRVVELEESEDERKRVEEELELRARLLDSATDSIFVLDLDGNFVYLNEAAYKTRGYSKDELMGMDLRQLATPEYAKLMRQRIQELLEKGEVTMQGAHICKDKSIMPIELHSRIIESNGRKLILAIARDITERKLKDEELEQYRHHLEEMVQKRTGQLTKANKQLKREISERRQTGEAIQAMVESTARITGRDFFSNMVRTLCKWLRCDVGIVGELIDDSTVEALTMQVDGKIIEEYRYTLSGTPCDNVKKKGFCHYPKNVTSLFPDDKDLAELDLSGYVGIPLHDSRGKPLGILCAMSHKPMELPERAEEVMGVFAARAAGEIERKKVEAELRKDKLRIRELATAYVHAQEEERQWIALEVHDRILQTLTAIFHQLQILKSITQATPEVQDVAAHAFTLIKEAIHETRNVMKDLYPQALAKFGLVPLMNEELHRFEEETGTRVRLLTDCPVRAPRDIETTFYRIFHEAILNVKKHATNVKKVTVSLTCKKEVSKLQVKDDGDGFDAAATMQGKVTAGLESMRRRAEIVGGTFEVKSISGKGTTVTVHIPLLPKTGGN